MNVRRVRWLRARRPSRPRLLATAVAILAVLALLATKPTWSAFSGTTSNPGNTTTAGTVTLTDNDSGTAIFNLTNLVPGDTDSGCLQVTYSGTLPALLRLYHTSTGSLASALDLTITRGTISSGSFDDCSGFVADTVNYQGLGAGIIYAGTLAALGTTWSGGLTDPHTASVPEAWTTNEVHAYKLKLTVRDDNNAQTSSSTTSFGFEAQNAPLYSQVILSDTPAAYWKLDETVGTSAADSAGTATGTYTNGPLLNQTSGVKHANTAVTFDGTDDQVAMGDVHDFAGTASFSIELWLNPTAPTGVYRRVIAKEISGRAWWMELASTASGIPNRLNFVREDAGGSSDVVRSSGALQAGTWYQVVGTYDGTTMKMYVNGSLTDSAASSRSIENHSQPFTIGRSSGGGSPYGGLVDEVAVYSSALTAQQVSEHYNAGRR